MQGLVLLTVTLLVGSLAVAQEPAVVLSPTNHAAAREGEALQLVLPKVGVELNTPGTPVIGTKAGLENGSAGELFQYPTNDALESSIVKSDEEVIPAPLDSLQFKGAIEVARAGGMLVSGPLVQLFDLTKPVELPKRCLQLVNPFAPLEASPVTPNVPNEHPRAWTELVGWNPGVSAFPDPRTHQPTLNLFSMFTSP